MTSILYWNLSKFSKNKIDAGGDDTAKSEDRWFHILGDVFLGNVPDIFVIVECYAGIREVGLWGTLVSANVRMAVTKLLGDIRVATENDDWYVVPPVCSGYVGFREGVAVFYNGANLRFDGPYVWGPDYRTYTRFLPPISRACPIGETARPAGLGDGWANGPEDYPAVWGNALPNGASIIPLQVGMPHYPGYVPLRQLAAQCEFLDATGRRFGFPNDYNRCPYLVQFTENPGTHNARAIKLFAVHTSPGSARGAVRQLGSIRDFAPVGANGVTVMLGDFNVDTIDSIGDYARIAAAGFTMHIDPRDGVGVVAASRPYCQTHLLKLDHATPFNALHRAADATHNPAPAFGYMGVMTGRVFQTPGYGGAIDNVFTRYGVAGVAPPAPNTTVVNTIVGSPYANLPAAVPADLTGAHGYAPALFPPLPAAGEQDNPPHSDAARDRFRRWANFGVIRDTSDHLPLIVDV